MSGIPRERRLLITDRLLAVGEPTPLAPEKDMVGETQELLRQIDVPDRRVRIHFRSRTAPRQPRASKANIPDGQLSLEPVHLHPGFKPVDQDVRSESPWINRPANPSFELPH